MTRMAARRKARVWTSKCSLLTFRPSPSSPSSDITRHQHHHRSLTASSGREATPRNPRWGLDHRRATTFIEWGRTWWASRLGHQVRNRVL